MPRLRRQRPGLRAWTFAHKCHAAFGWDDWGSGWPDVLDLPLDQRHAWPGAEVLNEMKRCWLDTRDEMLDMLPHVARPWWGELVFEQGVAPSDAFPKVEAPAPNEWQIANGYA